MEKITNIEEYKKNRFVKTMMDLTTEDIFNLFLIFARGEDRWPMVDLNVLMESLAKYKDRDRYASLYRNLKIEKNKDGKDIINLEEVYEKAVESRMVIINPSMNNEFIVFGTDEEFTNLRKMYDEPTLSIFESLMFNIRMDLEYGIDNWSLVAEDEYIDVPNYPGIVTGEFIGQEKDQRVMKKVRKRAIERLQNLYKK